MEGKKMKKVISLLLVLIMAMSLMVGCGGTAEAPAEAPANVEMKYMTPDEVEAVLGSADYTILDVRKAADSSVSSLPGSVCVDMDAAKEGDHAAGVEAMKPVVEEYSNNLILVCYSGKRYAQATTNALKDAGYDMSKVFTLEGGFTAWSEQKPQLVELKEIVQLKDQPMNYITAEEAAKLIGNADYSFIDVRKEADSTAAHIPGALCVDMDAAKEGDFMAGVAAMKPVVAEHDNNLILICYSGKRYAQATTDVLASLGYDMSKVFTLEGGFNGWSEKYPGIVAPTTKVEKEMQYMTPDEVEAVLGNADYTVIDVRKAADSSALSVVGSVRVDMDAAKEGDFEAGVIAMAPIAAEHDNNLILVCYSGKRYAQASTDVLASLGYDMSKVFTLEGGFTAWSEQKAALTEVPGTAAETVSERTVYVDADYVKDVIDGKLPESENFVVLTVAYPGTAADFAAYGEGHIPGAVYASIMEVEDATGDNVGAYNLLSAEEIRDYALSHGITKDTTVIMYGPDISGVARQAYAYLYIGVENVKILNGGIEAWIAAGYELETAENAGTAAADFGVAVPAHPEYWTSIEDAKAKVESDPNFKLVSIRAEEEWLGKTSGYGYMDKAGEPKGAVWGKGPLTASDVAMFTNEDGTVKTFEEITEIWKDCNFTLDNHLAFYCGTGWRACVPFLVMYQEGYDNISVFDGGWYQWLMDDSNPVQVGDPATAEVVYTTVGELPTGMAAK